VVIPKPVINTFNRVGIKYQDVVDATDKVRTVNRFSGEAIEVTPLVKRLIDWVYKTSNDYEMGNRDVNISDFDRVRYFILKIDSDAYMTCID